MIKVNITSGLSPLVEVGNTKWEMVGNTCGVGVGLGVEVGTIVGMVVGRTKDLEIRTGAGVGFLVIVKGINDGEGVFLGILVEGDNEGDGLFVKVGTMVGSAERIGVTDGVRTVTPFTAGMLLIGKR